MEYINKLQCSTMLLVLLLVGWATEGWAFESDEIINKYKLSINIPNKNGISSVYYSSESDYGYFYGNDSVSIIEGEDVYISYSLNSGYKCKNVTLNGLVQSLSSNYFEFVMPGSDVELIIDTEFDPSSPSDPQPADTTKYYNLSLVCNPSSAGSISGNGKYAAGNSTYIYASANSGYVFTGWSKDGEIISKNSSFYYTMPTSDAVLTANFVYNPSSPSDPQQSTLKHPLTVIASPAGAGSFSYTNSEITYGEEYYVYAYPNTGYKFKGWIVNGVAQENTSTTLTGMMTEVGAAVVGLFVFDPSSPSNPGANYYNSTTGQAIIDDFTPGSLYNAIYDAVGSDNYENVSNLIVKGRLENGDYGSLSYLSNATTIDLSRTGGSTSVPGYAFQNLAAANILLSSEVTNIGNYVFSNCANLTSLTVYAQVPPTCSTNTFKGFTNKNNCTVFVPASAIELYATADYWKDFTILPISTDAHVLQVNLPADASDGRYKHNSLEIVNLNSGVRQKYVISDRLFYTFNGLRKDEQYNIYMYSQAGLEIGRIENVVIPDQDMEVTFDNLKTLHTVNAKVFTKEGNDVTSQVTVEWLKPLADGTITYLRKADSLGEVPEGQQLLCRVSLDNKLGVVYLNPGDVEFTVKENENTCTITLVPFRSITLSGTVVDADGTALSGASVSMSQVLNGKFNKTFTAKTDRKGVWSASVLDAPETCLTYAATECINVNDTIGTFDTNVVTLDVGKVTLKSIVGARITYGFTYHAAGVEVTESYYDDYQNVAISVYNVTQKCAYKELSLQYPVLAVLDEKINVGDELKLTATSKTGVFNPIEQIVTIGENQRAEVMFDIIGKGGISASYEMTKNPSVVAMLYSSKGELLKKMTYSEATVKLTELEDGDYTLVTMGLSDLMNSILRLSNFAEIGLTEGKDFVKNSVKVESGKLSEIKNEEIPAFDESLFYYTNSSTSFSSNKSSITTGNYLTLRSSIDFKGVYKNEISNVALVVDLPEDCDFVEQSVIQGPNLLPYILDNNRLTIQLGNDYKSQVRFCAIPTVGGIFNATASVVFDYNGKTITQPIGSAMADIKDIEVNTPSVINRPFLSVKGKAMAKSSVNIYWNKILVGTCKTNASGEWSCDLEFESLNAFQEYQLFAEITLPTGHTIQTETKNILYDYESPIINSVTMINQAHSSSNLNLIDYVTVFDFSNNQKPSTYWYWPSYPKFTFIADITGGVNNTITDVTICALTENSGWVAMETYLDETTGKWIAVKEFHSGNLPINVGVNYKYTIDSISVDNFVATVSRSIPQDIDSDTYSDKYDVSEDENSISFTYKGTNANDFIISKVVVEEKDIYTYYTLDNVKYELCLSLYGSNAPDEDFMQYELYGKTIFDLFSFRSDTKTEYKIYYPISFIDEILKTKTETNNEELEFFRILKKRAEGLSYICVAISLVCEDKSYLLERRSQLDYASEVCPELEPIIDRMRRRNEHSRRMNEDLDNFRRPLGLLGRILGRAGGPLGNAAGAAFDTGDNALEFSQGAGNYINGLADRNDLAQLEAAGCLPPEDPIPPKNINPNDNSDYVMDPSGYVYEAVPTNRVEGVQATIYYKETKEDMYGDLYDEVVLWNAEEYAQKNPLFTDENGMYRWDVPQGLWQVKFEKDGYQTAYSEWLPVPPPQLEVNIGIVQNKQPEVIEARAYEEGVEVLFDKFMDLTTLTTSNIYVTANGEKLNGEIRFIDSALADEYASNEDSTALRYASRVRFVPETPLSVTTGEIRVTVSRNVLSYAGIPMTETFSQVLDVEKEVQTIYADDVKVLYGGEKIVTIYAVPFDAAAGRTLRIANSSDLITSIDVDEAVLDEEGKAEIKVKGILPGSSQLTFSIDDVTATGTCAVDVVTEIITAEAPKASRASGTAVYRGTKIELTTDSKDAVIYFTTDGSCPCDKEGTRRKYTVPIIINEDTQILAMTSVGNSDDDVSETVEFNYTLKRSDIDFQMSEGWTWVSHNFESAISPSELAVDEGVLRILSQSKEVVRDPQLGLVGTLTELTATESYKVETSAATARQRLSDIAWNPATPIGLNAGWNWIGYPVSQTMSVDEAFATTDAEVLDVVVGQNGFAQFDGEKWVGTLETMSPGMGYMYQSKSVKNVVYNTSIVSTAAAMYAHGISRKLPLVLDIHKYGQIMPVIATIKDEDVYALENEDYQVAAFCGSECRGIGRVVNGLVMMNVYGNINDNITFQISDINGEKNFNNTASLSFSETVVGNIFNPYTITVNNTTGITDVKYSGNVKVSVAGDILRIDGVNVDDIKYVEIYDINGFRILRETNISNSEIRIPNLIDGVYVVVVNGNGEFTYHKIAIR